MPVRLLAIDYDGTVAEDGAPANSRVREALAAARARGVHVILATGRSYLSASRYAASLELTDPVICFQGAMVKELDGKRATLFVEPLPEEPLEEVLAMAEQRRLELQLYGQDELYHIVMNHPPEFYDRWFGFPMRLVDSFGEARAILAARGERPLKGLFVGRPEVNDAFSAELERRFAGRLAVVRSHPMFVEVSSLSASKGHALAFLAGRYGIAREDTAAVGDSGNDISMIQWAGLGIAMGNATPDVLAVADWVAPPVREDGLAAAIDRHVLSDERGAR